MWELKLFIRILTQSINNHNFSKLFWSLWQCGELRAWWFHPSILSLQSFSCLWFSCISICIYMWLPFRFNPNSQTMVKNTTKKSLGEWRWGRKSICFDKKHSTAGWNTEGKTNKQKNTLQISENKKSELWIIHVKGWKIRPLF